MARSEVLRLVIEGETAGGRGVASYPFHKWGGGSAADLDELEPMAWLVNGLLRACCVESYELGRCAMCRQRGKDWILRQQGQAFHFMQAPFLLCSHTVQIALSGSRDAAVKNATVP